MHYDNHIHNNIILAVANIDRTIMTTQLLSFITSPQNQIINNNYATALLSILGNRPEPLAINPENITQALDDPRFWNRPRQINDNITNDVSLSPSARGG